MATPAYVLDSRRTIAPFGDPVSRTWLGDRRLGEHQDRAFADLGLPARRVSDLGEISDPEYLLIVDYVFVSTGLLRRFLEAARAGGGNRVLGVPRGPMVEFTHPIQGLRFEKDFRYPSGERALYDVFYVRERVTSLDELRARSSAEVVELRERTFPVDLGAMGARGRSMAVPLSNGVVMHLGHWVHVWQANVFTIGLAWAREATARKAWLAWILLRSLFATTRGKIAYGFLGRLNVIGKGCLIHPSATVEGCILGPGVHVGAGAQVRFSLLGAGASIGEQAIVNGSVVGDKSIIAQQAILNLSAIYPESFVKTIQGGLVGSESFVGGRVRFYDLKLEGSIEVEHDGGFADTKLNFLAGCVGHKASISGPVWFYPGRAIPNGYRIIQHPKQVVGRIAPDLSTTEFLVNQGGRLIPVSETRRPAAPKPETKT
ncbi:MAG: hypothetical protein U0610_09255 [bacterium]